MKRNQEEVLLMVALYLDFPTQILSHSFFLEVKSMGVPGMGSILLLFSAPEKNIPRVKGQHIFTKPMYFLKGEEEKGREGGRGIQGMWQALEG